MLDYHYLRIAKMKKADIIKDWLERNRKKQKELASELGVSEATISKIISGERHPGWRLALKMSRVLGVPMESLFQ